MDLQAVALVPAQLSLMYIHTEFLYSSMMKGPSIFELSLEASCWWMKIKSVVKRRWASEMAACPVASIFCVLNSRRGPVNKEVGIVQDLEFMGSLRIVHFWCMRWWAWRLGVSKCSIDSMSLCASSFAQSMCFFSLLILTAWCLLMGTRLLPSPGRTNRCITVVLLATSLVPAPIAWCVEMVWLPRAAQGKVISWLDEISSRVQLLHDTDMFLRCWNPVMLQGSFWFSQAALRGVFDFAPANATCLQEESIRGVWWKFNSTQ